MKCLKKPFWFTSHPADMLTSLGVSTERRRAEELESLFDGDLSGYYYVAMASDGTDEAIKWVLSALAAHLNEKSLSFSAIYQVMPADYLRSFIAYMKNGKFDKGYAKDIFTALLKADRFADVDFTDDMTPAEVDALIEADCWTRRLTGSEVMDKIVADPRFKAAASSEIDAIIDSVLAANADQAAKVPGQPQLVQWFVGQVMKAAKGKATGPTVSEKLKARFGV